MCVTKVPFFFVNTASRYVTNVQSFNAHEQYFLLLIVGGVFVPPMRCRDLMDGFITILA